MSDTTSPTAELEPAYDALRAELAELCRTHDLSLELIERSHDLDELLERVVDEYETRLRELAGASLDGPARTAEERRKVRGLVRFATQAAALKKKAELTTRLREANERLSRALADEEHLRRRLDEVLGALDAGILILDAAGRIETANRAAAVMTGVDPGRLVGREAAPFLGEIGPGSNGEVRREIDPGDPGDRVLLVARRPLSGEPPAEVVLLHDVTERDRRTEERHRLEKLAETMKTLGALSHKINNPLTSLMGRAQLLQLHFPQGSRPEVDKALEVIEASSRRISGYIRELAYVVQQGRHEAVSRMLEPDEAGDEPTGERP